MAQLLTRKTEITIDKIAFNLPNDKKSVLLEGAPGSQLFSGNIVEGGREERLLWSMSLCFF